MSCGCSESFYLRKLFVRDTKDFREELSTIPSLCELGEISIKTTIVRARVDVIIEQLSFWNITFGRKGKKWEDYKDIFLDSELFTIPCFSRGLWIPKTQKWNLNNSVNMLIKIIIEKAY